MGNGIAAHVGKVWRAMISRSSPIKDLSEQVLKEMELDHLHVLIQDARFRGNYLTVVNKVGRRIVVDFEAVPALRSIPYHDRDCFEIQENGSCLYWWTKDIHLDFESFLYYVDDDFRQRCDERKAAYYREYGKAIAIVRWGYNIPADGIAGLKVEDVQDIELGYLYPLSNALSCYAKALELSLNDFFDKVAANVDVLKALSIPWNK